MNFTVSWRETALDELADLWNNASDPNAVAAASDLVDEALSRNPLTRGESRTGNDRLMFEGPLSVWFRVDVAARHVLVLSVGPSGQSP